MSQVLRTRFLYQSVHRIAILAVMLALAAWGGREVSFTGDAPAVDRAAQQAAWVQQSIDEQVIALGCDDVKRLSPRLAVRPAQASPSQRAHGHWVFDTAVVTTVPFDEGLRLASAGDVWVVGWCG